MGGFRYWSLGNIEIPLKPRYPPSLILSRVQNCQCSFWRNFLGKGRGGLLENILCQRAGWSCHFRPPSWSTCPSSSSWLFLRSLKSRSDQPTGPSWTLIWTWPSRLTIPLYMTGMAVKIRNLATIVAILFFDLNKFELRGLIRKMSTIALSVPSCLAVIQPAIQIWTKEAENKDKPVQLSSSKRQIYVKRPAHLL